VKFGLLTLGVIVALLFVACDEPDEEIPDNPPDISGEITDIGIDDGGTVVSVFVAGDKNSFFLRVDADTEIFRSEDGDSVEASRDDLSLGQQVDAWISGAINPSEPPQGNAGTIVIKSDLSEDPSIRGTITDFTAGTEEGTATILVEGEIEADTSYDKASVRIDGETEIVGADGEELSVDDLEEGQTVEAWFEGPVAESYPVQAYAAKVVVTG
jgi:hypothetical protein